MTALIAAGRGFPGLSSSAFGRWAAGAHAIRRDREAFARYWARHNDRVLAGTGQPGPLWVALGDSTAQGLGAASPGGGYAGQVLDELRRRAGQPWNLLNLSASGACIRDVLDRQLPRVPAGASLVTCGVGANDVLRRSPVHVFRDLGDLLDTVPDGTVMLDLPRPAGLWGLAGRALVPYADRANRAIREGARARGLPVAGISAAFTAPWHGKLSADAFHPSQDGYRDWARALIAAIPAPAMPPGPGSRPPGTQPPARRPGPAQAGPGRGNR